MKSVHLACSVSPDAMAAALAWVEAHGAMTAPLLRRAVRDEAILSDLKRRPGQYAAVAAAWGVSTRTVREVEEIAKTFVAYHVDSAGIRQISAR